MSIALADWLTDMRADARLPVHLKNCFGDIGLWIATVVVAGPPFIYYVNGFAQFGMHHTLDFERPIPF